jgi:hypothetical protein
MNDMEHYSSGKRTRKLLSISSAPIGDVLPHLSEELLNTAGRLGAQLNELLTAKNGFYAFESALHVLPASCPTAPMDLERWNDTTLWKGLYGDLTRDFVFFAEDVLGGQFGIRHEQIHRFAPETGETEQFANNLEEWANKILDDYEYETGHPIAKKWQELHGPLNPGTRLFPRTPFVLGGEYSVDNLFALPAPEGMRYLADIYSQIADLPDGTSVEIARR